MTAGSVAVPTIIPLRFPSSGLHKTSIDSNTKIELRSETKDASIFYTINGTKPEPFQRFGDRCTMEYRGPFTLPAGKQTVKAVALITQQAKCCGDKTFEVEFAPPPEVLPVDDDMEFQNDLKRERSRVHFIQMQLARAKSDLLRSSASAWTDVSATNRLNQTLADTTVTGSMRRKSPVSARFTESRHHPSISRSSELQNQWIPPAYPPTSFRAPLNTFMPHSTDISMLMPSESSKRTETKSVAVQTAGLFYPSQRKIDQIQKEVEDKMTFEKQMRDRRPVTSAVSPGRGYWRKQVDHICLHLKAHAQNDAEFRALIADPKMGRLITSSVQEDGFELSLTLTFAIRESKDPFVGRQLGISTSNGYLSQRTDHDSSSEEEIMSEDNITSRSTTSTGKKKSAKRSKAKKKISPQISPQNVKLLRHLGEGGEDSGTTIQQLIDEGADPNCINKSGLPALHVAAKNKRIECIPVLIQAGAEVNAKGPSSIKGNSALHEAVTLGPDGIKTVETLLNCGADQNVKNDRGETAFDMATKAGYENIIKCFTTALGQSKLQKMVRPRSSAE
ncbi:hypothetical protein C0Q70_13106 [Pomacea canaliculata]|uniref:Uncharacterized protein n=1 Tax=Pomacea canaliculata TaxID=400727 RepID=A0A2T7NW97_POMCA|nr:hypothetical protein C0Q70_13106 [Pomacea canaliculata]